MSEPSEHFKALIHACTDQELENFCTNMAAAIARMSVAVKVSHGRELRLKLRWARDEAARRKNK